MLVLLFVHPEAVEFFLHPVVVHQNLFMCPHTRLGVPCDELVSLALGLDEINHVTRHRVHHIAVTLPYTGRDLGLREMDNPLLRGVFLFPLGLGQEPVRPLVPQGVHHRGIPRNREPLPRFRCCKALARGGSLPVFLCPQPHGLAENKSSFQTRRAHPRSRDAVRLVHSAPPEND